MSLFRREVVAARRINQSGRAIVSGPPSGAIVAVLAIVFIGAFVAFVRWGTFTRRQSVAGFLVPDRGVIRVHAPAPGLVLRRPVRQGERVVKGQLLAVISTRRAVPGGVDAGAAMIREVRAEIHALRQEIDHARALEQTRQRRIHQQTASLERQLAQLDAQIRSESKRRTLLRRHQRRMLTLRRSHLVAAEAVEAGMRAALAVESGIDALKKTRVQVRAQVSGAKLSIREAQEISAQEITRSGQQIHALRRQLAALQAQQGIELRAPAAGKVAAVSVEAGQAVTPSTPVVSLIPAGSVLRARLLVPTAAVGFVAAGQAVLLRYAAFPYQHFGMYHGRILSVAQTAILPNQLRAPLRPAGPVYPVTVVLDSQSVRAYGHPKPLQAGMLLRADIIVDREPLYRWILDPLYSLKGSIGE